HDVIKRSRIFNAQRSCHALHLPTHRQAVKSTVSQFKDRPEWPLVKGAIISGAAFPESVAMGDFHELMAGLIEEWVSFGSAFHGAGLSAVGAPGHSIAHQINQ